MEKLKICPEILKPMDYFNLAWSAGSNLALMGKVKISSEHLTPLDCCNLVWATGPNLGLMGKMKISHGLLELSLGYWAESWTNEEDAS